MSFAFDNHLFQSPLSTPDPEQFDTAYEARYNPAYSSSPSEEMAIALAPGSSTVVRGGAKGDLLHSGFGCTTVSASSYAI